MSMSKNKFKNEKWRNYMRTKLCWIPFIPVTLIMIFLKYIETTLSADETFMGLDIIGLRYTVIALVPILLILCILISLFDRKTSPFYLVNRNIGAALFTFIAAVAVMFKSVMSIMNILSSGNISVIDLVTAIIGIIAGIAILFMASYHLSGKNYSSSLGVLMLFPALWAAFELILIFLSYTTISVLSKDMLDLICFALIALFLFTDSMVLGSMEGKNPVKRCFIYGMPTVAATFAYTTYQAITYINTESLEISDVANTITIFAIGAYALFEIIELTFKANTKEAVVVIDKEDEVKEYAQSTVREEVDLLLGESENDHQESLDLKEENREEYNLSDLDIEEDISPVNEKVEENKYKEVSDAPKKPERSSLKETNNISDLDFVIAPKEDVRKNSPKNELDTRMDQIDKLILEIQSKQNKND